MAEKRKQPSAGFARRVKARKNEHWDAEPGASDSEAAPDEGSEPESDEGASGGGSDMASNDHDHDDDDDDDDDSQDDAPAPKKSATPKVDFSSISFGALAKAQASLPPSGRKSKRAKTTEAAEDKPARLPRALQPSSPATKKPKPPARTDRHAPQEQSSKHPVSRRREILADPRRKARDPRFDNLSSQSRGNPFDEAKALKNYAFLDDYRESEMADLRKQIKKCKDPAQRDGLKRELHSMESKKQARVRRDEEARLLAEHRQQEKELVAQGKQPFYLKKSEQKKKLLTDRFKNMSKGQIDHAIERKRKKVAGKEKKELGSLRRVTNRG